MLAYVFWHRRNAEVKGQVYRQKLVEFHKALKKSKPKGFLYSVVFQGGRLPWMKSKLEVYEEWYVTTGSCALDALNAAAVSGACAKPHENIASLAAAGTARLYLL